MTQQFTPSTDGQNVSIAAGADPTYTARVRGVNWRPDVMLALSSAAELRTTQFADADTYYVRGVGEVLWDEDDTTADNGTTVFQITGVPTGRYKLTGGSSLLATVNGVTAAVSGTDETKARSPSVSGGKLYLPRQLARPDDWFRETNLTNIFALDSRKGVVATGSDIDTWTDQSGLGINATAAAGARPTIGTWASDGGAAVAFNGTANYQVINGALPWIQGADGLTLIALLRFTGLDGQRGLFGAYAGGQVYYGLESNAANGGIFISDGGGALTYFSTGSELVTTRDQLIMCVLADGANASSWWVDGKKIVEFDGFTASGAGVTWTGATIGCFPYASNPNNYFLKASVRHILGFAGHGDATTYKDAYRGILGHTHANLVTFGNSLFVESPCRNNINAMVGQTLGGCRIGYDVSAGGRTTQELIALVATEGAAGLRASSHNIALVSEGGNDIRDNGLTARQGADNMWTLVDALFAIGYDDVIVATEAPRSDVSTVTMDAYSALIRAEYRAHECYGVAEIGTIPQLRSTSVGHWNADGVHHTTAGYALRANAFAQPVLRRITEL